MINDKSHKSIDTDYSFCTFFTEGPDSEEYSHERVPDNTTLTDIDLGSKIGGMRKATAEIVGDSLISYLHKYGPL